MGIAQHLASASSKAVGFREGASLALKGVTSGSPYGVNNVAGSVFTGGSLGVEKRQYEASKQGIPFTAIRPIANTIAKQPFIVGKKERSAITPRKLNPGRIQTKNAPAFITKAISEGMEIDPNHELLDVFDQPNPIMTGWAMKYCLAFSLVATGKAFLYLENIKSNLNDGVRSVNFWYLPSTWVRPIHKPGEPFHSWKVIPPGTTEDNAIIVPADEMAYFPYPDPENPLGVMSPVQSQSRAINTDDKVQDAQMNSMINGGKPGMVLKAGRLPAPPGQTGQGPLPTLTPEQRSQLISAVRLAYSGVNHYNDPIILDGMIEDVYPYTLNPLEMDFLNSSSLTKDRVMQGIGTNPIVVGQMEGANRASSYVAQEVFYTVTINPLITLISEVLTARIGAVSSSDKEKIYVWIEEAKAYDADVQIQQIETMQQAQAITKNEIREAFGFKPMIGGDVLPVIMPGKPPASVGTTRPPKQKSLTKRLLERLDGIEQQLSSKDYDPSQPRTSGGKWSGGMLDAADVVSRVQKSPNFVGKDVDWVAYSSRWGVSGTFYQTSADIVLLDAILESGALGISRDLSEDTIADKMESGILNPTIITRPPNERSPLFVVDGTHSLVAAIRKWKAEVAAGTEVSTKSVSVIVSGEAAAFLSLQVQKSLAMPLAPKAIAAPVSAIEPLTELEPLEHNGALDSE